jgi:uncharacterized membrane protein YbhN (UPF0104 family)
MWSWRRWAVGIVCVVLLAVAVHVEGPMLTESIHSFAHLRWRFVIWAVLLETMSMFALALMERRILTLAGVRLPVGRAIAIAYASNAMAQSLPIIGSGAATGFSYRRLVSQGAAPPVAGWALILAGIVSNAAFVVVISIGAIVSGNVWARRAGPDRGARVPGDHLLAGDRDRLADLLRADARRAARPQTRPRGQPRRDWRGA